MLLFESLGLYHSISIEQPVRLSLPSPGGVPLNGLRAQVGFGDNNDNLFRYTNIPNSNLSIPYVLLLVAGWVLGFPEKCSSKISYPRPQRFLNYHIKGNCRSTSSISCLIILYCSGKWVSAACR